MRRNGSSKGWYGSVCFALDLAGALRPSIDEDAMKQAIRDVIRKSCGLLEATRRYGIKKSTLQSRINKIKPKAPDGTIDLHSDSGNVSEDHMLYSSKYTVNQVFTNSQELELTNYIKKTSVVSAKTRKYQHL